METAIYAARLVLASFGLRPHLAFCCVEGLALISRQYAIPKDLLSPLLDTCATVGFLTTAEDKFQLEEWMAELKRRIVAAGLGEEHELMNEGDDWWEDDEDGGRGPGGAHGWPGMAVKA